MMLVATLALALMGAPDDGQDHLANPHVQRAARAFAEGRYADAADALEIAYAQVPHPDVLFAWAQAVRSAGRCDAAIDLYRRFLATATDPEDIEVARSAMRSCGGDPDARPTPPPPPRIDPTPAPPPSPPERRAIADPLAHALTWPGLTIAAAGAGMLSVAHVRRDRADRALDESGYRDALRGAPALSQAGIAVLAVGGALLTAGVVRFAVLAARARRTSRRR